MICFVDTSAFLAVLDKNDDHHIKAKTIWLELLKNKTQFVTTNFVLLETIAILQNRIGIDAVQAFNHAIYPLLDIIWIDKHLHDNGVSSVLIAGRKKLSLVDCISFNVMRQRDLQSVFTFDKHFSQQGFQTVQPAC